MNEKEAYVLLIRAVKFYRERGKAGSTIAGYLKPVLSWLLFNELKLNRKIKIEGANRTPTLEGERPPEQHELASVWRFCDERKAAAISLLAFAGPRPRVLGNYKGTDALRLKDLPELKVDNAEKTVTATQLPMRVVVRGELSKMGHQYESFLCEEGYGRVAAYLTKRMRSGEVLGPESPVIAGDFGATVTTKTVCQISRNNAEVRVRAIVEGRPAPTPVSGEEAEELPPRDIEEVAHNQIITHINQQFKGHELARLVDAVLQAEGYLTRRSPPGPDGGVDILASKGAFGFDEPKLVVQVKSGDTPLDVTALRLPLDEFRADHGLLVSLSGFKRTTLEEARRSFFKIRLWDADALLDAILKNYERLPEDIRAELPLKRVWALVPPEEE